MEQRLSNGSRVCIVGGGPAGSFSALHLLALARRHGLDLEVLIFEPRDFARPGPGGCNRCAGILSSRLLGGLTELGVSLPDAIVQAELRAYAVHLDGEVLRVERPDPRRRIVSVYRGGGPRLLEGEPVAGLDAYLLAEACARGARHIPERVQVVNREGRPVVQTARGSYASDFLVLATGVNSRAPLGPDFGYRPPRTEMMAQDEVRRPPTWPDDQVDVFFGDPPGLVFGALIPKGRHLNISLLGHRLTRDAVQEFIEGRMTAKPDGPSSAYVSLCGCTPRVGVGSAPRYFGDRWAAVGDAAVTRLYKDGIGSAFFLAGRAMETAVTRGVSRRAFARAYAPHCRRVVVDNLYGRALFRLWSVTLRTPRLLRAWSRALRLEGERPPDQRIHQRILWGMFTGDEPYGDLFWRSLTPDALLSLGRSAWHGR